MPLPDPHREQQCLYLLVGNSSEEFMSTRRGESRFSCWRYQLEADNVLSAPLCSLVDMFPTKARQTARGRDTVILHAYSNVSGVAGYETNIELLELTRLPLSRPASAALCAQVYIASRLSSAPSRL